jgi:hypothetical protein
MKRNPVPNDPVATNNSGQATLDSLPFPQALLDHVIAHYKKPSVVSRLKCRV